MKRLIAILTMVMVIGFNATSGYAVTTVSQSASATVAGVLSIEFESTTYTTFGSGTIPWTNIDPSEGNVIPPTGADRSGSPTAKMDTAVICKYNGSAANWYLKMSITGALAGKVKFYMPKPVNRNTNTAGNGTLAYAIPAPGSNWPVLPSAATTMYTSGTNDTLNTPFGDFCGVNYGLNPVGLLTGTSYGGTITYTITTTP